MATDLLSRWLSSQLPAPIDRSEGESPPVAVLLGRGPQIARATTAEAARLLKSHAVAAVYVSGDQPRTAKRLLRLGVPPERVAGDSCARTTWENATLTTLWLQSHHPGAPVLLISDPAVAARHCGFPSSGSRRGTYLRRTASERVRRKTWFA